MDTAPQSTRPRTGRHPVVVPLGDLDAGDLALAGGKAANLGELIGAGFPVPDGFCVTTDAYAELAAAAGLAELLDGPALPAAQQDTYLDVIGEDGVLDAVHRCWASLWTDRAVVYRERNGIDSTRTRLAVVVQRMVDAAVAGVMFTANPVTGRRTETVVDAAPGLGEAVVSGSVDPPRRA